LIDWYKRNISNDVIHCVIIILRIFITITIVFVSWKLCFRSWGDVLSVFELFGTL
jgi:hypothetical protein